LLRSAHASGDSPWGDPVYAAGFLYAFERGGHRRWEASSGFYAEYVAGLCRGSRARAQGTRPRARRGFTALQGIDDALDLQRGEAVVIHGAAGGAPRLTRARCCRAGFAFFPSRSSFSDKRLPGAQRPARQSPKLHP